MFTIYTVVKPFRGEYRNIQYNALRSWLALEPRPEVLVFGAGEWGAKTAARRLGVPIYPVERNEYGTPLLRSAIERAETVASHDVSCYVNADIVILQDFIAALEQTRARFDQFLLSARRWNVDLENLSLDFSSEWEGGLRETVEARGELHRVTGIDVFCYRGVDWGTIPAFAVGRRLLDNWLIYRAIETEVPFVDATAVATVVHQEHGVGGEERLDKPEWLRNRELFLASVTPTRSRYDFSMSTHRLTEVGEFEDTHFGRRVRNDRIRARRKAREARDEQAAI